jgi:hypothetical protein
MRRFLPVLSAMAIVFLAAEAAAQTVVQLPTFSNFSVSTSVLVPDSGGAYLGGVSRAAAGRYVLRNPFCPLADAFGIDRSAGGAQVTATIHDLPGADRLLLAGSDPASPEDQKIARSKESSAAQPAPSVAEARRRRAAEEARQAEHFLAMFEKARSAEEEGKGSVARIYYRIVAQQGPSHLKSQAVARLAAILRAEKSSGDRTKSDP